MPPTTNTPPIITPRDGSNGMRNRSAVTHKRIPNRIRIVPRILRGRAVLSNQAAVRRRLCTSQAPMRRMMICDTRRGMGYNLSRNGNAARRGDRGLSGLWIPTRWRPRHSYARGTTPRQARDKSSQFCRCRIASILCGFSLSRPRL